MLPCCNRLKLARSTTSPSCLQRHINVFLITAPNLSPRGHSPDSAPEARSRHSCWVRASGGSVGRPALRAVSTSSLHAHASMCSFVSIYTQGAWAGELGLGRDLQVQAGRRVARPRPPPTRCQLPRQGGQWGVGVGAARPTACRQHQAASWHVAASQVWVWMAPPEEPPSGSANRRLFGQFSPDLNLASSICQPAS